MKENEGKFDFLALVFKFGFGERRYHRFYINAAVGWGDDSGAEFPFLRERSF